MIIVNASGNEGPISLSLSGFLAGSVVRVALGLVPNPGAE